MKKIILERTIIATMFAILTACSMGPSKVDDEVKDNVAVIRGLSAWNPLSVIAVELYKIDGKKVTSKSRQEVSPGEHQIEARCSRETPTRSQQYFIFQMYLKAGHEYKPKLDMTKDCYFDYVDVTTGKRYTGIKD